jgi:hypothetical protein
MAGDVAEVSPVQTQTTLQQLVDKVVETMAITKNDQEIRVVLKEVILPNTEIRINAANHQLLVQFITTSDNANQWLTQQLPTMQSELTRVLNRPVDVSLSFETAKEQTQQERPF